VLFRTPDRRWLVAGESYGLTLWDLSQPEPPPQELISFGTGALYIGLTSDERWLYAAHSGQLAGALMTKWDLSAPQPAEAAVESGKRLKSDPRVSRNGDLALAVDPSSTLYDLWDVRSGEEVQTASSLDKASRVSSSSATQEWFIADDTALVTVRGLAVTLWAIEVSMTSTRITPSATLRGHEQEIAQSFVSADARWLVTIDAGQNVRVWDIASYRSAAAAPAVDDSATPQPATATPLPPVDTLLTAACERMSRNLTRSEWRIAMGDEPYRRTCPDLPNGDAEDGP
jgi:WD40 repeat protein